MRPDTFTELIRRKLESIRPDLTERDWTRMQSSLRQAGLSGPPGAPVAGVGSVPSWLMTVAGIGTAALLTVAVWQRSEINTLREKLLQQTTTQATATAPATLSNSEKPVAPTPQPDTVYVTRYVPVEPTGRTPSSEESRAARSGSVSATTPAPSISDNQLATSPSPLTSDNQPIATNSTPRIPVADAPDAPARQPSRSVPGKVLPTNALPDGFLPLNVLPDNDLSGKASLAGQQRLAVTKESGKSDSRNSRPKTNTLNQSQTARPGTIQQMAPTTAPTETVSASEDELTDAPANSGNQVVALTPTRSLLNRPINWNARLARRLSRPVGTAPVISQPESPRAAEGWAAEGASQSVVKLATAFRIGVGSDLRARYWNTGIVAETVFGGHWVLSAGLIRSSSLLGSFITDDDYDYRTRRNFRREFAPGFDQKREIYGIEVRSARYQIPVSIGYRIPVGKSLSVLPSVGAYLDLSNDVGVMFSYRTPQPRPGYETAIFNGKGPVSLLNAYTAGAALEWQQKHWVVQGGVLYAHPLYSDMNGTAAPSLGGRVRLFYQF
ncbi:MAG: hypothetical protein H7319_08740 [Spirosoma sp.]|nr:hypothetical protein [Spirosoma sp.]